MKSEMRGTQSSVLQPHGVTGTFHSETRAISHALAYTYMM
jgi:hypothetical protein